MLKRLVYRDNLVLSLKLKDDLFTLTQLRTPTLMEFFNIKSAFEKFEGIDLNKTEQLFCAVAAPQKFRPLMIARMRSSDVLPNLRPLPNKILSPIIEPGRYGANLIEHHPASRLLPEPVIKAGLNINQDLDLIELAGMIGDPGKLKKRLICYFESGVNWDESKEFLFKGIKSPPPHYQSLVLTSVSSRD